MLFATVTKKLNRLIAPALLKHGLTARYALTRGNIQDTPYLDYFLLLPLAQSLLSIEIQEIARETKKKQLEDQNRVSNWFDKFVDRIWDRYLEPLSASRFPKEETKPNSDNPRLDAFQEYLRPILIPNNRWSDIQRYRFHQRFIKWLRSEYLICRYEPDIRKALATYTQLKVTPLLTLNSSLHGNPLRTLLRANNSDTSKNIFGQLPNAATLDRAFDLGDWNPFKSNSCEYKHTREIVQRIGGDMEQIPRSSVQIAKVPMDASLKDLTMEEILEVSGCHVSSCGAFNALCEEAGIYEFWTQEYVSALANYLRSRCNQFDGHTVILDVGAGDGILVHYLNQSMSGHGSNMTNSMKRKQLSQSQQMTRHRKMQIPLIVATDDGSWNIHPKAKVEKLSVMDALRKYHPFDSNGKRKHQLIVICSWMPMGIDWTQEMRDSSADEYILIGECDDGNCGDNWLTFGNPDFNTELDSEGDVCESERFVPDSCGMAPYQVDGYVREDLEDLSLLQYSRFDSKMSGASKTVSFRKCNKNTS